MKRIHALLFITPLLLAATFFCCASHQSDTPVHRQHDIPPVLSDFDQGLKLIEEKDYAGGKTKLEEAVKSQPANAKGWFKLGRLYLGYYKDPEKAIEYGERALEYDPSNAEYHEFLGEAYARLAQRSGKNFKALRFAKRAKRDFNKAVELSPENLRARRALMEYLAQAPQIAGGSWDKAKIIAEETSSIDVAYAHLMLASLYRKKGETGKAEEAYVMAIEADPQSPSSYIEAGWFYFVEKRYDEARIHFQKYQELKPHDPSASLNSGWFYVLIGEFAEAEVHIRKAIEIQPRYVEAWYRLGDLYERKGEKEQAQSAFEKCTELDGDNRWTGTAKEREEERKKTKKRRLKLKRADWQHYTVVGVLQSQQEKNKHGETRTVYVVEDANGILFHFPVESMEAEELVGRKIKVVGVGVERTNKKGTKKVILKEIADFEEVE